MPTAPKKSEKTRRPYAPTQKTGRLFRFALLLSFFLHLVVILGMQAWLSEEAQREIRYPVLLQGGSPGAMRFAPTLPPSAKDLTAEEGPLKMSDLLGRGPAGIPGGLGQGLSATTGTWIPGASSILEEPGSPGGKPGIFAPPEEPEGLALVLKEPLADMDIPLAMDPLELDAERRERTVVLLDPQTRRLKKAYLHLPVYLNSGEPGGYEGGREVVEIFRLLNSKALPWRTPIECEVNYYRLGRPALWLKIEGIPDPDPIHTFFTYPNRHLLHHTEMAQYPVLFLRYIDVESTQAMVEYLASGGFAVVNPGQLNLLYNGLQERAGKRVQRATLDLGHPLFHCWFDITQYWDANQYCPALAPFSGLVLDGRLVALCSPAFVSQYPCSSNRLYINVLVYGLVQPSRMGGRYQSRY